MGDFKLLNFLTGPSYNHSKKIHDDTFTAYIDEYFLLGNNINRKKGKQCHATCYNDFLVDLPGMTHLCDDGYCADNHILINLFIFFNNTN